jgi:WD40 repeat protein
LTLSDDASQVAVGTSTGVLSILDLTNNNYRTIVRSHTENVLQLAYHPFANSIISLSSDFTIRLWDPEKLEQTYEFSYPANDNCLCLAPNP